MVRIKPQNKLAHISDEKSKGTNADRKKDMPIKFLGRKGRRMAKILERRRQAKRERTERRRRRKRAIKAGLEPEPIQTPKTIESMRRVETWSVDTEGVACMIDEFQEYYNGNVTPKILITSNRRPSYKLRTFIKELLLIIPNSIYLARSEFLLKNVVKHALNESFTAIIMVNQGRDKLPHSFHIATLPDGPTVFYRLTSLKLASEMVGAAYSSTHYPEIVLDNFTTVLGQRLGRQLGSLFPPNPDFEGRRVITFRNQRDFIFFRHHRYVFRSMEKCSLVEIGPRFTLKIRSVQEGAFDLVHGLYEFLWKPDLQVDRKRFFL
ncbi:RPF1, ribosome production factor 1 [Babesia microti strain RI]|uniref:RPF1, ribosome production factor 1 n=1 Tax=Babesia microti (strain RI) TaxID=1133968 RepID=I7IS14_BABMR|nr:RPF1, ribosome production factor 1 [Babesia microti strain RI]CCF75226.2 RPF1, ribosome production factor 1 [Babesia microti strain RI]|eukprot:XP_021337165.1 RPF1, ribosome production factor 1 [Babesia microti strain RI]